MIIDAEKYLHVCKCVCVSMYAYNNKNKKKRRDMNLKESKEQWKDLEEERIRDII
jgi:hypothetical protein